MKKFGKELAEEIKVRRQRFVEAIDRRMERIYNCETDMDDCFISHHIEQDGIRECDMQLRILDGDGTQEFEVLVDENGSEVRTHWFTNKWGKDTIVGNGVFASSLEALIKKTGWRTATIKAPVWTKYMASGSGMCGVMNGSTEVVRWHTNMVTGEYVGYPD